MAGVSKRRRPTNDQAERAIAAITQAQYMVAIYAEIVAMDQTIIERVRALVVRQSSAVDRETSVSNLRLVLVQLEKVGERIAFWNSRVHALVRDQLPR
jgi:L-lactate utilization protein LutC